MRFNPLPKAWLAFVICIAALLGATTSTAAPFIPSKSGETVYDAQTKLVWARCSVGQKWDGQSCLYQPTSFDFSSVAWMKDDPDFNDDLDGFTDWTVPTLDQLLTLRECSSNVQGNQCNNGSKSPTIDSVFKNAPGLVYFVLPRDASVAANREANYIDFKTGEVGVANSNQGRFSNAFHIRLVRKTQTTDFIQNNASQQSLPFLSDKYTYDDFSSDVQNILKKEIFLEVKPKLLISGADGVQMSFRLEDVMRFAKNNYIEHYVENFSALYKNLSPNLRAIPDMPELPQRTEVNLVKGQYETTKQFEDRLKEANRKVDEEYSILEAKTNKLINDRQKLMDENQRLIDGESERISKVTESLNKESARESMRQKAWRHALELPFGDPVIRDVSYDADNQKFTAVLGFSNNNWNKNIEFPMPLDKAERYATDLASGKIAPVVTFQLPDMTYQWRLEENEFMRQYKFQEAKKNQFVDDLLTLIDEYPNSQEAKDARKAIFFDVANSSAELVDLIKKYPNWDEAKKAKTRVAELQKLEFNQAKEDNRVSAYEYFIEHFGGEDTQKLIPQAKKLMQTAKVREERERKDDLARAERERKEAAERDRKEAIERERKYAAACDKYYAGYVGNAYVVVAVSNFLWLGTHEEKRRGQFIVIGSGNGDVSIKGTDDGRYPGYGNVDKLSCVRLQELENNQ